MKKFQVEWTESEIVESYFCEIIEIEDDECDVVTVELLQDIIESSSFDRVDSEYFGIPTDISEIKPVRIDSFMDVTESEEEKLAKQLREVNNEISSKQCLIMNTNSTIAALEKERQEIKLKLGGIK